MKSPAKFWGLAILGVVLVIGLGGWALHLHAKLVLARIKAHMIAAREKLSVEENLPKPVPDSENGAKEFMDAESLLPVLDNKVQLTPMAFVVAGRARCAWMETNAITPESTNAWPNLRVHFQTNQEAFFKIRAALEKPHLQFRVAYGAGFGGLMLSHLARMKSAAQRLSVAVLTGLHDGGIAEARMNLRALVAIPSRCHGEPLIISELVRMATLSIAATTTWETLQHPGWSEVQLAEMQGWWEAVPKGAVVPPLEMERAMAGTEYERCRNDPAYARQMFGVGNGSSVLDDLGEVGEKAMDSPSQGVQLFLALFPRRWAWRPWNSYHDEAWSLEAVSHHLKAARDWERGLPFVGIQSELDLRRQQRGDAPPQYLLSATAFSDVFEKFLQKEALAETQRRLVITAIALRRHQLKYGSWPTKLEELAPQFLGAVPLDPMDGKPLRYQSAADGAPKLYSVGIDGADAGGDPSPLTGGSKYWMLGRDIVWPQRASAEELNKLYREMESKRPTGRR